MMKMSDSNEAKINEEMQQVENLTKVTPRWSAWTEDDKIILRAVLPGVNKDDIEMKALQDRFLLRARRDEIMYNLDLGLDLDIKPQDTKAEYSEGLLRVELKRVDPLDNSYEVPIE
jgi:HSP20 family molecular chaperone IbpA